MVRDGEEGDSTEQQRPRENKPGKISKTYRQLRDGVMTACPIRMNDSHCRNPSKQLES